MHTLPSPHKELPAKLPTRCAALLVLLWSYAALSKFLDYATFLHQLQNQNLPAAWAPVLAGLLPAAELLAALLLLLPNTRWYGLALSAALLLSFTSYIVLVLLHYWRKTPCSCGGLLSRMGWNFHFWFNCFFLGLALAGLVLTPCPWKKDTGKKDR